MTLDELRKTHWWDYWERFTGDAPNPEVMSTIRKLDKGQLRVVIKQDALMWHVLVKDKGDRCPWAISSHLMLDDAIAMCHEMGWRVKW